MKLKRPHLGTDRGLLAAATRRVGTIIGCELRVGPFRLEWRVAVRR